MLYIGRSVGRFVCRSARKGYCGKKADWIWIPFKTVSEVGQRMDVLDGCGDRKTIQISP